MTKNLLNVFLATSLLSSCGFMGLVSKPRPSDHEKHDRSCKKRCESCDDCVRGTVKFLGLKLREAAEARNVLEGLRLGVDLKRIAGCGFDVKDAYLDIRLLNVWNDINPEATADLQVSCGCPKLELRLSFDVKYVCDKCPAATILTGLRSDLETFRGPGFHILSSNTRASEVSSRGFKFQHVIVVEIDAFWTDASAIQSSVLESHARHCFANIGFDFIAQCTKCCK